VRSVLQRRKRLSMMYDFSKKTKVVFASSPLERNKEMKEPIVIPNVHTRVGMSTRQASPGRLLFVGNLGHKPNAIGICEFLSSVFPLLPREVQLTIVGRSPVDYSMRRKFLRLTRNSRITVAYDVPNCAPYFDQAMVSIVPIRHGGGTKVKIIESFAAGVPVVSTRKGCEGLSVENGRELLIADTPTMFAAAISRLLDDKELNERLSSASHEFYLRHHTQDVVDRLVKDVFFKSVEAVTPAYIRPDNGPEGIVTLIGAGHRILHP
jgi:hypothetical protein